MIVDMEANGKLSPLVTELFLRGRKLNISLTFTSILFSSPKTIKSNATHYFIMKISNTREHQQQGCHASSKVLKSPQF